MESEEAARKAAVRAQVQVRAAEVGLDVATPAPALAVTTLEIKAAMETGEALGV